MKTQSNGGTGGWLFALATLATAAILFFPVPYLAELQGRQIWITPKHLERVIALGLSAIAFWNLRQRLASRTPDLAKTFRNGIFIFLLQATLLRIAVEVGYLSASRSWTWCPVEAWLWMPWFLATGLAVILLGNTSGILISLGGALLLYLRVDPSPVALIGSLATSLSSVVLLRRLTRGRVLRAGIVPALILGLIAAGEQLGNDSPWTAAGAAFVLPTLIGLASALAVLTLLPFLEWALGALSDVRLAEFASGHLLLDELKEKAPGTWNHSLNVADLAEKAAAAIGARALFCRTAALYHDVGKLKAPGYFAENLTGPSPHDQMDPFASAERIIGHVTDGLELARKHRLPKPFRQIIAEHHGISVVRYFFNKACSQLREGEKPADLRTKFQYPGPPPSTKESGIIALADIVEAAARSTAPKSEAEARSFVRKLVGDRIAEGELAQCPLTLAELATIEETFISWLMARNHQRPTYPVPAQSSEDAVAQWNKVTDAAQPA